MSNFLIKLAMLLSTVIATMTYNFHTQPFVRVDIHEVQQMQASDTVFLLYTGRKTCPYCRSFVPKLHEASKDATIYYLDSEDYKTNLTLQQFRKTYHIETVPNLSKFSGKELIASLPIDENLRVENIVKFIQ